MSEEQFDVIIVGAGCAGCVAACLLAKAGLDVVVIERGNAAGTKNMTGGRLYAHSLERILPGFAAEAPVERLVTRENISFMSADSAVTLDYRHRPSGVPLEQSYTVLRSRFDSWLMSKAEENGAQLITGIRVDAPIVRNGVVCGVKAGGEELEAHVVLLADGVNSLLAEKLGLQPRVSPSMSAVGVKELLALPREEINDRFSLCDNEGLAWLFAGSPTGGLMGGGFLYVNGESLSLGIVCGLQHVEHAPHSVPELLDAFKRHPVVAPLIKGGKLLEYSGHVVPEGGLAMVGQLVGDGVLVAGDAAGLCLNVGYTIRGMDLAMASGEAAANAILDARHKDDFSKAGLASYQEHLKKSFIMQDLTLYRNLPAFFENKRLFNTYPQLAVDIMHDVFTVGGAPACPAWRKFWARGRHAGIWNLMKDAFKGGLSL